MRLEVQFRHMDRSEALETLAVEKISAAVEEFVHRHDAHVQVWLNSDLNRANRGTGQFTCEIDVRYPKKKELFVSKSDTDIHTAIQEAADSLAIMLDEAGKREISLRREPLETRQ
jgi:ribosomal subunit interface protein